MKDNEWINKQLSDNHSQGFTILTIGASDKISEKYKYFNYIIDPNKFRLKNIVRIVGLIMLFVRKLKARIKKIPRDKPCLSKLPTQFAFNNDRYLVAQAQNNSPHKCPKGFIVRLSEEMLNDALDYFYKRGTSELKHFQNKISYKKLSEEKDGILYYTGRVLASQQINSKLNLSDVCMDLTKESFCVPLIDRHSPLAYAIVNEVHWYSEDARHSGNETV